MSWMKDSTSRCKNDLGWLVTDFYHPIRPKKKKKGNDIGIEESETQAEAFISY